MEKFIRIIMKTSNKAKQSANEPVSSSTRIAVDCDYALLITQCSDSDACMYACTNAPFNACNCVDLELLGKFIVVESDSELC